MTFGGCMLGVVIFFFLVSPKSFGRHCAEIARAYRTALEPADD